MYNKCIKNYFYFFVIFGFTFSIFFACKPTRKMQSIDRILTPQPNSDSLNIIQKKIEDSLRKIQLLNEQYIKDSLKKVDSLIKEINDSYLVFNTLNAKMKIELNNADGSQNYAVNLSIIKDSIMFFTIRANILGISAVGAQIIVKQDSFIVINKVAKKIEYYSIQHISNITKMELDFNLLQDLLLAHLKIDTSNLVSLNDKKENISCNLKLSSFNLLLSFLINKKLLTDIRLEKNNPNENYPGTLSINYTDFIKVQNHYFPQKQLFYISGQNSISATIEYKEILFNQPIKYSFDIPKNTKNIHKNSKFNRNVN